MLKLAFGDDSAGYLMKINYYRPCPEPDWVMGIKAHTDFNGLTLLIPNEIFGLQVFKEDRWLDVDYIYPAVIIIIGDQIMKMSNGRYNNVLHRALMDKKKTRMSSVVHIKPPYDMVVSHFPNSPAAIILPSSSL
jgi:flavonol synthase